ncbi:unnamed protein product [Discosporangium mesarthrocarpum]
MQEINRKSISVLVCCCGLPGSGKTTFCQDVCTKFQSYVTQTTSNSCCGGAWAGISKITNVCFDDYIEWRLEEVENQNLGVSKDLLSDYDSKGSPSHWWHEARRDALTAVVAAASSSATKTYEGGGNTGVHMVLVDDNMHFRSMRHEIMVVAREHSCGYAQAYFPVPVETAIKRDSARERPVTESVIQKMATKLQPPEPDRFPWERHTLTLGTTVGEQTSSRERSGVGQPGTPGAGYEHQIAALLRLVDTAASSPVPPLAIIGTTPAKREADRETTKHSALHELDLKIRKATGAVARRMAELQVSQDLLSTVMKVCASSRKIALVGAKQRDSGAYAGNPYVESSPGEVGEGVTDPSLASFVNCLHEGIAKLTGLSAHERSAILGATE